jgi:hypothetical protein
VRILTDTTIYTEGVAATKVELRHVHDLAPISGGQSAQIPAD